MTKKQFIADHGPDWKKFEFSEMGKALFQLVEASSPARRIPVGNDMSNLRLVGAPVLLNEIAGYELLANLLRSLGQEPKPTIPEPEDTFTESEI